MANAWINCFTFEPALDLFDSNSTTRGGEDFVAFTLENIIDPSRDNALTGTSLPEFWSISTGPSSRVQFTTGGAILSAGPHPAGVAKLTAPFSDYIYHDAVVDVDLLLPVDGTQGPAEIIALETVTVTGATARVGFRIGIGSDKAAVYAYGEATVGGTIVENGVRKLPVDPRSTRWALQLVRKGRYVYGNYGTRDARTREFSALYTVFEADLGTDSNGTLSIVSDNLGNPLVARGRATNFTIESHATINNRLITNKTIPIGKQIRGLTPAAPLEELGLAVVEVFGLFGIALSEESFEYVLPAPRTVGNEVVRALRVYTDPVVRDT